MSLSHRLTEYIAAAFTGIWIQSHEHHDALIEIARMCKERDWSLAAWDVERGLQAGTQAAPGTSDPLAAIRSINAMTREDSSALLVLPNFHRFLQSAEIVQALAHQIQLGKQNRSFIIILSPIVQIPIELEKAFMVIEHELPDRQQLEKIARGISTKQEDGPEGQKLERVDVPEGADLERVLDAASGLTRFEAEGAFSLSLAREGKLTPKSIWELKGGMLKKSGLLTLYRGGESFADLGGLDPLKAFSTRALTSRSRLARPRGILLLGIAGGGKSAFCKALGNETGRPTLIMDVGALMGSLVGQTEQNIRQALRIVDAMSPAVLMLDEVEKALSGIASSGQTDSGVSARLFGTFLTWLSDHTSDIYVVCTSNDISKLPPEFSRAERFDGIFFLDTPGTAEKEKIWPIHLKRYGIELTAKNKKPQDREWTGAEIQSCCRLSALLDLPLVEAAKNVVPVAVTAAEQVEKLRAWATGRCLDASRAGIYMRGATEVAAPTARRVARASNN